MTLGEARKQLDTAATAISASSLPGAASVEPQGERATKITVHTNSTAVCCWSFSVTVALHRRCMTLHDTIRHFTGFEAVQLGTRWAPVLHLCACASPVPVWLRQSGTCQNWQKKCAEEPAYDQLLILWRRAPLHGSFHHQKRTHFGLRAAARVFNNVGPATVIARRQVFAALAPSGLSPAWKRTL